MIIIYNLFLKYFILTLLIMTSLTSLFFFDILMIWFLLEINNLLFICILNLSIKDKKMIFFYFIIQIIPSFLMIYSIILNNIFFMNNYFYMIMIMSLMIKLSLPPFHFWLPIMSKYLTWKNLFLMLTLQKIIPFYSLSLFKMYPLFMNLVLILCALLPPYIMLQLNNFKMLLSYSSINQSGWMMLLIYSKNIVWFKYFAFYTLITICLTTLFYVFKTNFNLINNMSNLKINLLLIMFMFNLAGMPPFSFFYMKWYLIFSIFYNSKYFLILILLMISSLIMLYIYVNMVMITFYIYKFQSKLFMTSTPYLLLNKFSLLFLMSLMLSLLILII